MTPRVYSLFKHIWPYSNRPFSPPCSTRTPGLSLSWRGSWLEGRKPCNPLPPFALSLGHCGQFLLQRAVLRPFTSEPVQRTLQQHFCLWSYTARICLHTALPMCLKISAVIISLATLLLRLLFIVLCGCGPPRLSVLPMMVDYSRMGSPVDGFPHSCLLLTS